MDLFRNLIVADGDPARRPVVIAEGVNVVDRAIRSSYVLRAVVGVPAKLEILAPLLRRLPVPVYEVDKWTLSDVAGFRVTRGVLGAVDRPVALPVTRALERARRLVVLETINDYENLGAIFRNAAAFGADAVLLDARCADPLYRRSVRVSMGHVFGMPFAVLPDPFPDRLRELRDTGFDLFALTPSAAAIPVMQIRPGEKWAILLGAEGPGLSPAALTLASTAVCIPMAPGVDSLNVATAGAVALAQLTAAAASSDTVVADPVEP